MNHIFQEKYKELGISKEVYEFGEKIEQEDCAGGESPRGEQETNG